MEQKKVESPDEPKVIERSKSFEWARKILNDENEDYKTEVLQSLYVELADLRAQLKEAKAETFGEMDKVDALAKHCNELKADNERLRELNKTLFNEQVEDIFNNGCKGDFTSELQRRWPSAKDIKNESNNSDYPDPSFIVGFKDGVQWLKSYLENK